MVAGIGSLITKRKKVNNPSFRCLSLTNNRTERLYFLKYILQDGRWKVDFLREASKHLGKSLEKPALAKSALEEIYQTREKQERFMNGEIGEFRLTPNNRI